MKSVPTKRSLINIWRIFNRAAILLHFNCRILHNITIRFVTYLHLFFFLNIRKLKTCESQPVPGSFKFGLGQFNHFDAGQNDFSSTSGIRKSEFGFFLYCTFLLLHFITVQNNCVVYRPHGSTDYLIEQKQ